MKYFITFLIFFFPQLVNSTHHENKQLKLLLQRGNIDPMYVDVVLNHSNKNKQNKLISDAEARALLVKSYNQMLLINNSENILLLNNEESPEVIIKKILQRLKNEGLIDFGYISFGNKVLPEAKTDVVAIAQALMVLAQTILYYYNEISVITAEFQPIFKSGSAQINATKVKADQISLAITKALKIQSNIDFMKPLKSVGYSGRMFTIGGVASNACLKSKNQNNRHKIDVFLKPVKTNIKNRLLGTIKNSNSDYDISQETIDFNDDPVSPFFGTTNIDDETRMAFAIKQITNPKVITLSNTNSMMGLNSDQIMKYFRYELFVGVIHDVLLDMAAYRMQTDDVLTKEYVNDTIYAKTIMQDSGLSLMVKNKSGNNKELNETLSDNIIISIESNKLLRKKNALLSIMVSSSIAEFEGVL